MTCVYVVDPSSIMHVEKKKSKNPVNRFIASRKSNGPEAVFSSIVYKSDDHIFKIVQNPSQIPKDARIWIPEGNLLELRNYDVEKIEHSPIFLGPNIDWFNQDNINGLRLFKKATVLAPASWVVPILSARVGDFAAVKIWAAGVDCQYWRPNRRKRKSILIYLKDYSLSTIANEFSFALRERGIKVRVIEYGKYSKKSFRYLLSKSVAAIWLGGTESQGIALMEAWAMDVPTLVLKRDLWVSPSGQIYEASSAPYMDENCGEFFSESSAHVDHLDIFLSNVKSNRYAPREYVERNFERSFQKRWLFDIIQNSKL